MLTSTWHVLSECIANVLVIQLSNVYGTWHVLSECNANVSVIQLSNVY